ncbi:PAS domain S-box protein [Paenibacillus frigoriresistens]|uniref:PAS domain-containing sensor histidine kinase n=1 Tax=Paenibacillus alginolyticus TaxID=59839 RepID=UPI0015646D7E|nr:PAS domain S-box protein [Paenibacillus frigoriresistens]NRF95589.1 PAS domain S-box protein [Paenibacillus frigoriresistens]
MKFNVLIISIILYVFPIILDIYSKDYVGELGWFLYPIFPFFFSYYFGLKGGVFHVVIASLIFFTNQFLDYRLDLYDLRDPLLTPYVFVKILIVSIGAAIVSNKLRCQKHELELANKNLQIQKVENDEIFNNLNISIWKFDLITNEVRRSTGLEKITGFRQNDLQQDSNMWTKIVHPDDFKIADEHYSDIRKGNTKESQYRIISRDGNIKWIENRGKPIFDSENNVIKMIGVIFDITERKQSETKFELMAESASDLVGTVDPKGVFEYVSPSHEKVLGLDAKQCVGTSAFTYMHPDDADCIEKEYLGMIANKTPRTLLFRYIHARGYSTYIESLVTPILESNGDVKNAVFVGRDITVKIAAEQALKENSERYIRLQTSLDHFSRDLFGVMKITEVENRLVREVMEVLQVNSVCIIEVERNLTFWNKCGNMHHRLLNQIMTHYNRSLIICEVLGTEQGCLIKIGESNEKDYILVIADRPLLLPPEKVWLKTLTRYVNVLYDNFKVIEDLTDELKKFSARQAAPVWLLRLLFNLTEQERKRLSQDLHDAALQEQIMWYRKLENLAMNTDVSDSLRQQLLNISEGLLDVIYQIRLTCNELRPPMLKENGLVSSLENLFEMTQRQTNYEIIFGCSQFNVTLNEDQLIGLYRIIQELLANATKHSYADTVNITLSSRTDQIVLIYRDNGVGVRKTLDSESESMGIYGMKERVRSLGGKIEMKSNTGRGLYVFVSIPISINT